MGYGGGMNELPYPSDLTAAAWALIEPLLHMRQVMPPFSRRMAITASFK